MCYGFARCAVFAGLVGLAFTTLALLAGGLRTWVFAMAVGPSFLCALVVMDLLGVHWW